MPTISLLSRAETRSISIDAPPSAVFSYVSDPFKLPEWAPAFADSVRPEGDRWVVSSGEVELTIAVRADAARGTVDLLGGPSLDTGAFSRVLPNAGGSEFLFTLFFPDGTPPEAIDAQMQTVEQELRTVRGAVENV